jgi:hypothetical protein
VQRKLLEFLEKCELLSAGSLALGRGGHVNEGWAKSANQHAKNAKACSDAFFTRNPVTLEPIMSEEQVLEVCDASEQRPSSVSHSLPVRISSTLARSAM